MPAFAPIWHFLAVLIRAGSENKHQAVQTLEPRQHVARQRSVSMPDVRHIVDVINGGGI